MSSLLWNLRLALRGLRRSPLFAVVAVISLALGIGANTAIFTLMDQILLRRLPIARPDALVMLYQQAANMGSNMGSRMNSYPLYQDLQMKAEPFSEVLCRRLVPASISVDNRTERVSAELVSGNYFSMLGVGPAVGRVFNPAEDDRVYLGHPVVVLSYGFWQSRFNGDRSVVGRKILVNDAPMTIVGVSAKGFAGLDPAQAPQIRVPILMQPILMREQPWLHMVDRRARWVQVFARLKPGYTAASAQAPVQGLFTQIRGYEMSLPEAKEWSQYAREQFMRGKLIVEAAPAGYSPLRNDVSLALVVLIAMVGLVLLIACANVANLLIARGFARQKEIAVRLSLGASRPQLVRQLLLESALLSVVGGVAGLGLAFLLTNGLLSFVPTQDQLSAAPDGRVLAFTIVVTGLTAFVFGLLPALRASRPDPWSTLKDTVGSIAGTGGSLFLRKSLVAAQVTLSFLLLFGAGLFVRSLQNLKSADTGMDVDNLVTFSISPALNGYDDARADVFFRNLLPRLRATSGVESAAIANVSLLAGNEWDSSMSVEGHRAKDGEDMQAFMNAVSPGYFATMKIPILQGRDFRESDAAQEWTVAIVNKRFADHFFPGGTAVGKHIGQGTRPGTNLNIEIIGVVADSLYEGPREGVHRQVFVPQGGKNTGVFYVRTSMPSAAMFDVVRGEVRQFDASMPVYDLKTLEGQLDETLLTDRLVATLSAGFGLVATLLACVGLYGVMAFVVARRRKELGIRIALGARPRRVLWLVMREVVTLLVIGLVVGLPAAFWLGRYVASQLYGVQSYDPAIAGSTALLLAAAAVLAGLIPANRASRIDPILALRHE